MKEFKGYLHEIYNDSIYFECFTLEREFPLDFIKKNNIYIKDTNILILFIGSRYPQKLSYLFHNRPWNNPYEFFPKDENEKIIINSSDLNIYYINSKPIHFTGFDYEDYKKVERIYRKLQNWGIYTRDYVYQENIKSKNRIYIVLYFKNIVGQHGNVLNMLLDKAKTLLS